MIARSNQFNDSYYEENNNNKTNEATEEHIPGLDEFDIRILNIQSSALLVMIFGYVLEYISTLQGIELIKLTQNNNEAETKLNPDLTALMGAQCQVIAQAVLIQIAKIQYRNIYLHYKIGDLNAARSASFEILLSDIIKGIGYIIAFVGIKDIYTVNNKEPVYGV